jgi:fatty-acyl-CoA synthase
MGAALAGLVLVTVNPALRPAELSYVLQNSRASGIFLVPEFRSPMLAFLEEARKELPGLREVVRFTDWATFMATAPATERLPDVSPDDAAQIQFTSGTTGAPKGALLHHRGITNNARFCADRVQARSGDVWLNTMPLFHTAGCVLGVLGALAKSAVQLPVVAFEPGLVLELIESERVTMMGAVPTMLIAMMEHPDFARRDLSSLREVFSGGTLVPASLVRRIEATLGVGFGIVFGTTECSPLLTQTRPGDTPEDKAETIGQALPQTELKVTDPVTRAVVPVGAVGELCARGYLVMKGYDAAPEATAEAIDAEGWYHTGDLASMDARGYLRVEGRLKDMIIRGGENIYPREIEELLYTHPGVGDAAIVGVPDEHWGEIVVAFVRPRSSGSPPAEAELHGFCRERLAPFKTPAHWVFLESFPLTPSGKIQKFVLRERLLAGARAQK